MNKPKRMYKSKMHTYTKSQVDSLIRPCLYGKHLVMLVNLSAQDIEEYRKHYKESKFEEYIANKHNYEPARKKIKHDENIEKGTNILKLVLSREGETDKFKSQFKVAMNNENDNTSTTSCSTSCSTGVVEDVVEQHSQTNESLPKSKSYIRVIPMRKLFNNEAEYSFFSIIFEQSKYKNHPNGIKKATPVIPSNTIKNGTNSVNVLKRGNVFLRDIEHLYSKYFSKYVQDSIVIIANILNMISMSNKHHKVRMDESFKKRTEAEKLKERCDANRMHLRHKKVLEAKLKTIFTEIVSSFIESEFEPTFQLFFLSILTVLRVLDQPKFKKGSIFKNLVLLLWNSLKNSDFEHPRVFGLFRSKCFRPDCIDLISLIEDSRDSDPGITDRMALFFVSSVNSRVYFQTVIDAVTSDSNEDLGLLIDNASCQCRIHSRFQNPINYSSLPIQASVNNTAPIIPSSSLEHASVNNNIPVTSVQTTIPMEDIQQWVLTKTSNGTYQPLNSINDNKSQKKTILISDAALVNEPRTYYENFSNSLSPKLYSESSASKTIAPKVSVTTTPVSSSVGQPTTLLIKQTLQNVKPIVNTTIQRSEYNTIFVGNKQYQLIRGPLGQMKAVAASTSTTNVTATNVVVQSGLSQLTMRPSMDVNVRCFAKNCRNQATIMCSTCTSVKYCTHVCQRRDWYESHIHNCERLHFMKSNQ